MKNTLLMSAFAAVCMCAYAIEPQGGEVGLLAKPDNAVIRALAAAENFPTAGWYDGKYRSLWTEKRSVPAADVAQIYYALADTAPEGSEWMGCVRDWTTDAAGDVLLFYVDGMGNWVSGYFVVYRRNSKGEFEYTCTVHTGSEIGKWAPEVRFSAAGFTLTYVNDEDIPAVQHTFDYHRPEPFFVRAPDFNVGISRANARGERIAQNALTENDSVCLFKICRGAQSYYLRGEDGEPYYLPERVQMSTLRWLSDDRFVASSLEGERSYIWQLMPGNRIRPAF